MKWEIMVGFFVRRTVSNYVVEKPLALVFEIVSRTLLEFQTSMFMFGKYGRTISKNNC